MNAFWEYLIKYIQLLRLSDFIDVIIVAIVIYYIIKLVRETRAMQLLKGIAVFFFIFLLSHAMNLNALNYILGGAVQVGLFAIVVIFQPELRNLLERMGRIKVGRFIEFGGVPSSSSRTATIEAISTAAVNLSASHTGALIVVECETKLGDFMTSGVMLEAIVSKGLLENIFVPKTPLHDGAVIIRDNKIMAAGCMLPLTNNNNLSYELGTRHRAAIGLSENTDAIIVVVSEETGKISIARHGTLTRNLTGESLKKALKKILAPEEEGEDNIKKIDAFKFWQKNRND